MLATITAHIVVNSIAPEILVAVSPLSLKTVPFRRLRPTTLQCILVGLKSSIPATGTAMLLKYQFLLPYHLLVPSATAYPLLSLAKIVVILTTLQPTVPSRLVRTQSLGIWRRRKNHHGRSVVWRGEHCIVNCLVDCTSVLGLHMLGRLSLLTGIGL